MVDFKDVVRWLASDGTWYEFVAFPPNTKLFGIGGVYIFAYHDGNYWRPVFVGETDDFGQRLPGHERWPDAVKMGATHIHARIVTTATDRQELERSLIEQLQPVLNTRSRHIAATQATNRSASVPEAT